MTDETSQLHCSKKAATFFSKEEATSSNNVMDKSRIYLPENVRNLVILPFVHFL